MRRPEIDGQRAIPVLVGQRGVRVAVVTSELGGEKIDVVDKQTLRTQTSFSAGVAAFQAGDYETALARFREAAEANPAPAGAGAPRPAPTSPLGS